jgi:hypothetical protein
MSPIVIPAAHAPEHEFNPSNFINSFVNVWRGVVLAPTDFFAEMPLNAGYANPLIFLIISTAIGGFFGGLVSLRSLAGIIFAPIGGIIGSFIAAGIIHIFAVLFTDGAKGGFQATWRVVTYSTALSVLTWIPFVGSLIGFYGVYLTVVGVQRVHATDRIKAALSVIVPAVLFILLTAILAITMGFAILQLFGTMSR